MREPTSEQRAKERSFLFGNLADVGTNTLLLVMAIATGSLTMLSEAARSWLMLTISFYSYWLMRALHRERLTQYEFGVGKIEQFAWVVIGLNLVVAALWVSRSVVVTVFSTEPAATPLGLTLSAMVNAINLLVNFAGWHAMRVATRNDPSGVFAAQLRARLTMLLSSLFLQITLTVAALAKDELIALTPRCGRRDLRGRANALQGGSDGNPGPAGPSRRTRHRGAAGANPRRRRAFVAGGRHRLDPDPPLWPVDVRRDRHRTRGIRLGARPQNRHGRSQPCDLLRRYGGRAGARGRPRRSRWSPRRAWRNCEQRP
jgi:Co/Zn/Cd efflux system component